jgi:hypothetical protein
MGIQGYGQLEPGDAAADFSVLQFIITQTLARCRTNVLVKVLNSTESSGAVAPPGYVNVQPLVNQLDGNGQATPHGKLFQIPVWRYGSGLGAVICDPQVGDVGYMAVCDRDISGVVAAAGQPSNPGSLRKFNLADGVYLGSLLGVAPTQSLTFTATGLKLQDRNGNVLEMKAGSIALTCTALVVNGVPMTIP